MNLGQIRFSDSHNSIGQPQSRLREAYEVHFQSTISLIIAVQLNLYNNLKNILIKQRPSKISLIERALHFYVG